MSDDNGSRERSADRRSGSGRGQQPRGAGGRRDSDRQGGERRSSHGGERERSQRGQRRGRPAQVDLKRRIAFDVLAAVSARDAYANLILPGLLRDRGVTGRDAAFATELTYGTLRAQGTLDAILAACSDRAAGETDQRVRDMLRIGAYQLLFMRVPPHAAVSETVTVAKVALTDGPARFVNAILRQVAERDLDAWLESLSPPREQDPVGFLSLHHYHPQWIVRTLAESLKDDEKLSQTEAAMAANNLRPSVHLALRPGQIERDEVVNQVSGEPGRYSPFAVVMTRGGDPGRVAAVAAGQAGVQDEGSQLVTLALANAPVLGDEGGAAGSDSRWLDMCAGPGGKAALLGGLAAERGAQVTAIELVEKRARLVERATSNLPVTVMCADAREIGAHEQLGEASFDRVLLDAPCTGLGALRRRPEARWRKQPTDIPALAKLQRELLAAAARAVRPGGVIAYTTCSPHLAETRVQAAEAARRLGLELVDARPFFPGVPELGDGPTVQLWPHRQGTDAMFTALFRRV